MLEDWPMTLFSWGVMCITPYSTPDEFSPAASQNMECLHQGFDEVLYPNRILGWRLLSAYDSSWQTAGAGFWNMKVFQVLFSWCLFLPHWNPKLDFLGNYELRWLQHTGAQWGLSWGGRQRCSSPGLQMEKLHFRECPQCLQPLELEYTRWAVPGGRGSRQGPSGQCKEIPGFTFSFSFFSWMYGFTFHFLDL